MNEEQYGKEQFLQSKAYAAQRDLLAALLADGEKYSERQVKHIMADFLHREAK
jgi:hypothetical protein